MPAQRSKGNNRRSGGASRSRSSSRSRHGSEQEPPSSHAPLPDDAANRLRRLGRPRPREGADRPLPFAEDNGVDDFFGEDFRGEERCVRAADDDQPAVVPGQAGQLSANVRPGGRDGGQPDQIEALGRVRPQPLLRPQSDDFMPLGFQGSGDRAEAEGKGPFARVARRMDEKDVHSRQPIRKCSPRRHGGHGGKNRSFLRATD